MKVFVTGVNGQLGHDMINELTARGIEAIGSDITDSYAGMDDGSAAAKAHYEKLDITDADAVKLFGRPVLGGFNRQGEINTISAEEVADRTRKILSENPEGRVMIGADCTVGNAPLANIQAAVAAAHGK